MNIEVDGLQHHKTSLGFTSVSHEEESEVIRGSLKLDKKKCCFIGCKLKCKSMGWLVHSFTRSPIQNHVNEAKPFYAPTRRHLILDQLCMLVVPKLSCILPTLEPYLSIKLLMEYPEIHHFAPHLHLRLVKKGACLWRDRMDVNIT